MGVPKMLIKDAGGGPIHVFNVCKGGIELELSIFSFEEDVRFRLFREKQNHALLEYQIMECKFARYKIGENDDSYLSFVSSNGVEVTLSVKPDIQVLISE